MDVNVSYNKQCRYLPFEVFNVTLSVESDQDGIRQCQVSSDAGNRGIESHLAPLEHDVRPPTGSPQPGNSDFP